MGEILCGFGMESESDLSLMRQEKVGGGNVGRFDSCQEHLRGKNQEGGQKTLRGNLLDMWNFFDMWQANLEGDRSCLTGTVWRGIKLF